MIPDMTARTPLGSVDLVPYMRRLRGDFSAPVVEGEAKPAALALYALGVPAERIGSVTGSTSARVLELVAEVAAGTPAAQPERPRISYAADPAGYLRERRRLRRAERIRIGGRLVHPGAPHGTENGGKNYGCQCDPCRAAMNAKRQRQRRAKGTT